MSNAWGGGGQGWAGYGTTQQPTYGDAWNAFNQGVLAPANAQADQSIAALGLQQGLLGANYDVQAGNLQQQLASGQARIGLSQAGLARQQQLEPQLADLQRQLFGISGQQLGLQREGVGISREGIGLQKEQAQTQSEQQQRGAWSGATARGATVTSGFRQELGDIGTALQQRLAGIGLQEKQLGLQERGIGLQEQQLGIGEKRFELTEKEKMAQLNDTASRLGLDSQDLSNRVSSALTQLGLDKALGTIDVIKAINDTQNGRFSALSGVLGQIGQIDPRLLQGGGGSMDAHAIQSNVGNQWSLH